MNIALKKWLAATRPWSIPASASPALLVGVWLGAARIDARWPLAPLIIFSVVLFHLAANLISDYYDFVYGVDTSETAGSRTLPDGIFRPVTILRFGWILLAAAAGLGIYLAIQSGGGLFYLGLFGALATLFYYKVKFHGAGIILIFLVFGPGIALGTEYALTSRLTWPVLLFSLPVGLLTTAILQVNDIRDARHDSAAGIKTFTYWIGRRRAEWFYRFLMIAPYFLVLLYCLLGILPAVSMSTWLTLPQVGTALRGLNRPEQLKNLDRKTALLQMVFSLLLAVSLGGMFR